MPSFDESSPNILQTHQASTTVQEQQHSPEKIVKQPSSSPPNNEFVNPRGIRFTTESPTNESVKSDSLTPYGWPCVRGLLRFLTTHINIYDKSVIHISSTFFLLIFPFFLNRNNTEYMITVGLNLLTVALEVGADYLAHYPLLLSIVKDSLCRNVLSVSK